MMWIPPPSWILAILVAFAAHIVVIGLVFYMRGWRRGAVAILVSLLLFLVSVALGVAAEIAASALDPAPIILMLAAGIYAMYALMLRRPKLSKDISHVV
jgi:peptidoglycan/LPS O-acetylase OafA/YrhL